MYVGTHYNGYYNSLFGDRGSIYSSFSKSKGSSIFSGGSSYTASSSSLQYVQSLKNGANTLNNALSALSSGDAFSQKSADSSDSSVLTVNSANNYALGNKSLSVMIDRIATGQANTGASLAADAMSSSSGYQQFSIETNGRTYQFSINVGSGDSNKDVQQKMAAAINMRSIGINATVATDDSGISTLSLISQTTGENNKSTFKIQDVYGDVVKQTGADQVSQEAQNAVYSVNGGAKRESQTNTVDLGSGVTATLRQASDEEVTVKKTANNQYAVEQVREMVDGYNQLYKATLDNVGDSKSSILFSQLANTSRTYVTSLNNIGISFDANGYMQADNDKLAAAAQDGSLEKFFSGTSNYGFANQMSKIASSVSTNTARYVSTDSLAKGSQDSYYNFYDNNFFNSYQNYMTANNVFNSGIFFDLML